MTEFKEKSFKKIKQTVKGQKTVDGAGVHLTRVIGHDTVYDFDPFLMLDSFDSTNPDDYTAGFPTHPHRGIETLTYLINGEIDHEDSLGNQGKILDGQSQWMTAGSGILHQEMPQPAPRMLGFQLWINMPANAKMSEPIYFDITESMIGHYKDDIINARVISGNYRNAYGVKPNHVDATVIDFKLNAGKTIEIGERDGETLFVFLIEGDAEINGTLIEEKTAVLFEEEGNSIAITAPKNQNSRFILFSAKPLKEKVAWAGPIVMNTQAELQQAFNDLRSGNFIKNNSRRTV